MMSSSRIQSAGRAANYYGKDDYYVTGEADSPGLEWGGKGAKELGLQGEAKPGEFKAILKGENPSKEGPQLPGDRADDKKHAPGWDFTFSAPKSVSVAIRVGGDERLAAAHDRAVAKAMDYAERNFAFTRVRENGERREVQTGNLVYATTVHGMSRHGDPQHHTHVVVANMTQEPGSGEWRALETLHIYRHRQLLGKIYQAELAKEAKELGYDIRKGDTAGTFELDAWSREQLRAFSKRREDIERAFEVEKQVRGADKLSGAQKDRLVLKDRPDKIHTPRNELVARWKEEAKAAGIDPERAFAKAAEREGPGEDKTRMTRGQASDVVSRLREWLGGRRDLDRNDPYGYAPADRERDVEARRAVSLAIQVSELKRAVFTRHEVLERAMDASRVGMTSDRLLKEIDRVEKDGGLVKADRQTHGGVTTGYALAIEREILQRMGEGKGRGSAILSPVEANQLLSKEARDSALQAGRKSLNDGQATAVATILASNDRYQAVQGFAGVGKTTMFREARDIASSRGEGFQAITPTHRAAEAMKREAGIHARTVTSWLLGTERALAKGGAAEEKLRASWENKRLLVDEASMLSNAQMQAIARAADRLGIKSVIFVGDEKQLPSPQAGAPFRMLLQAGVEQSKVTEIVRQRDNPTLRQSIEHLANGRPAKALAAIDQHIHQVGAKADDTSLARASLNLWRAYRERGEEARIVVPTNAMRGLTAAFVRGELKEKGELGEKDVQAERYYHVRVDGADRFRSAAYATEQRLVFHSAHKATGFKRGDEATIVGLDDRNDRLIVKTDGGRTAAVDLRALARTGRHPFDAFTVKNVDIAEGERMVWERPDARRGLHTGAGFTVEKIGAKEWTIRHEDGRREVMPADDRALKFSGYGYSETADRAQGQTYKSVVAVLSSAHGEAATVARTYVMQSRPSAEYQLVTNDRNLLLYKLGKQDGLQPIALHNIEQALKDGSALGRGQELGLGGKPDAAIRLEGFDHEKAPDQPVKAIPDRSL